MGYKIKILCSNLNIATLNPENTSPREWTWVDIAEEAMQSTLHNRLLYFTSSDKRTSVTSSIFNDVSNCKYIILCDNDNLFLDFCDEETVGYLHKEQLK
jgi:hypothetical protein